MKMKRRCFQTEAEAKVFAAAYNERVLYYSEDSQTKDDYAVIMKTAEGYFDEEHAKQFPYCVSYFELDS